MIGVVIHCGNIIRKKWKIIIRISKSEMQYLISNGVKHGEDGIIHTTGHHKSWYLSENGYCIKLLKDYRESRIAEK